MRSLIRNEWVKTRPFPHAWVAVDGEQLVGFVSGHPQAPHPILDKPPTALIGDLFVRDSHRRRGLALKLVDTFIEHAQAAKYEMIEVGTLTRDSRAVAFWRAAGFEELNVLLRLSR
ncbi:MAG: GNAT family N-acetyltransferase [Proteobacteria bacterium]|jgi:GNAT superfamily N-acetyltransferase|nr:GNAT family N-acetyltransferase [Pseudomonadota bacterium]